MRELSLTVENYGIYEFSKQYRLKYVHIVIFYMLWFEGIFNLTRLLSIIFKKNTNRYLF